MKQRKSVEDYLKTIYILSKGQPVHGVDIARELGVSRPTVSVTLKALGEEGYVFVDEMHHVHLTKSGRRIAMETYERHNTFRMLLMRLGVDEKTAAADACQMEHAVSRKSYEAIRNLAAMHGEEKP